MKKKKTMNIAQTEIVVVLDRSGSMSSIQEATVKGFNEFLNEQQNAEGEAFLTLVQFDDRVDVVYQNTPVKEVSPLISGVSFVPRGSTALLDTIGSTIEKMFETKRDVVFVIITDGAENASKTYKRDAVFKMISTQQEEAKWKFIFLGANQDAIRAGNSLGISSNNSINYSASTEGTTNVFNSVSSNIGKYRSSKFSSGVNDENFAYFSTSLEQDLTFKEDQRKDSLK
jgi:Mg-chelatase subunit ChlD